MVPTTLQALPSSPARDRPRSGERGVEVGETAALRTGHVVGHDVDPVEDLRRLPQVEALRWQLSSGREGRGQQVEPAGSAPTHRVGVAAPRRGVCSSAGPRAGRCSRAGRSRRILPVDVDPVEDSRPAGQKSSMQEATKSRRFSAVATASEKRPEPVQPPIEIKVLNWGCRSFSPRELVEVAAETRQVGAGRGTACPMSPLLPEHGPAVRIDQPKGIVDVCEQLSRDVRRGVVLCLAVHPA